MKKLNITIDGRQIQVDEGLTIFEAAKQNGIKIPTLCYSSDMKPFTSCFICVVEVKGLRKLVPSCSTPASEGIVVTTDNENIRATRKICLELLVSEHCGDCISPCQAACPAGLEIQSFLSFISQNNEKEALKVIMKTIPIPASLGRICPRPCEAECRRTKLEGPLSIICYLRRYTSDTNLGDAILNVPEKAKDTGKKVAIIGAGPSGLSAAYFLNRAGHKATIFESNPKGGGMLRYAIPQYRLPKDVLDTEIQTIVDMGVEIKYGKTFGKDINIDSLKSDGYNAILLAIGAQSSISMGQNDAASGVLSGLDFLKDVMLGKKPDIGEKVVVIGGGNTAVDVARTSLRLGAVEVIILYRRTRAEMPAYEPEVTEAEEEGVKINFLVAPVEVSKEGNKVKLNCIKMQLGEPDSSGRRRPVPVPGSELEVYASTVISAIGQKVDVSTIKDAGVKFSKWETIQTDPDTMLTNLEGVFAAGDCVTGPDIASRAIGTARLAAETIDNFLKGGKIQPRIKAFCSTMGKLEEIPEDFFKDKPVIPKAVMQKIPFEKRTGNFKEIEVGFTQEVARKESSRCLECGCLKVEDCILRELATEYNIDAQRFKGEKRKYYEDSSHEEAVYESNKCVLCGLCVRLCNEVKDFDFLGFANRGLDTSVLSAFAKSWDKTKCTFIKELVEICPTGAIALKKNKTK